MTGSALQCRLSEKKAECLLRGICSRHTWCLAVSGCALNSSLVSDSVPFHLGSHVACCGRGHGHVDGKKKESRHLCVTRAHGPMSVSDLRSCCHLSPCRRPVDSCPLPAVGSSSQQGPSATWPPSPAQPQACPPCWSGGCGGGGWGIFSPLTMAPPLGWSALGFLRVRGRGRGPGCKG